MYAMWNTQDFWHFSRAEISQHDPLKTDVIISGELNSTEGKQTKSLTYNFNL